MARSKKYTVKKGETLLDVAQKNSVALQKLRYANRLNRQNWAVKPGQKLIIPDDSFYVPAGE